MDSIIKKKYSSTYMFYIVLILMVWAQDFLWFVTAIVYKIPMISQFSSYAVPILFGIVTIKAFRYIKKIKQYSWLVFVSFASIYLLNYLIFPNNVDGLDETAFSFFVIVLPCFLLSTTLDFTEEICKIMNWVSCICIYLFWAYFILKITGASTLTESGETDYLSFAYMLLPLLTYVIWQTFEKWNVFNIVTSFIGILSLFSLGNRGSIICVLVFVFFYFFFLKEYKHKFRSVSSLIIAIGTILFFIDPILDYMYEWSESMGLSTRVFDSIQDETMMDYDNSSGRDKLAVRVFAILYEHPFGVGIAGLKGYGIEYSHNILFDLLVEYGVLLGGLMIFTIAYIYIQGFIKSRSREEKGFGLVLICSAFIQLMFSHSYIVNWLFFFSLGYFLNIIKRIKIKDLSQTITV